MIRVDIDPCDPVKAIEYCYGRGWTDGLPVVPPVRSRVEEMLDAGGQPPDRVLGRIEFRRRRVTVGKVAINAVMAGCLPEYFPVVLACAEAMLDDAFDLHIAAASTASPAILVVINGPIRQRIGLNCANNAFSPGWRANATIGRVIRLILLNLCGAAPAYFDGGTMGNPARFSYCIGENEEASPWEPLHVQRGYSADASTATLFFADAPRQINSRLSQEPEVILRCVADMMLPVGNGATSPSWAGFLVVIGPEHAAAIARRSWSKADICRYLFEKARRPLIDFKLAGRLASDVEAGDDQRLLGLVRHPDDLHVVVAGGVAGQYSLVIPVIYHEAVVTKAIAAHATSGREAAQ